MGFRVCVGRVKVVSRRPVSVCWAPKLVDVVVVGFEEQEQRLVGVVGVLWQGW